VVLVVFPVGRTTDQLHREHGVVGAVDEEGEMSLKEFLGKCEKGLWVRIDVECHEVGAELKLRLASESDMDECICELGLYQESFMCMSERPAAVMIGLLVDGFLGVAAPDVRRSERGSYDEGVEDCFGAVWVLSPEGGDEPDGFESEGGDYWVELQRMSMKRVSHVLQGHCSVWGSEYHSPDPPSAIKIQL
jgi:hypothetical protein